MIYALDSSAMIALLRGEPGADVVWQYVADESILSFSHSINLCEVYYQGWRFGGKDEADNAMDDLNYLGVKERNDLDADLWQEAGRIKAIFRRVSLANCLAIALTNRVGGSLVTSDHHELEAIAAARVCPILFFR